MLEVTEERSLLAAAEAALLRDVAMLDNVAMSRPSALPGWTRAMVVTHLARNADSNARMIVATLRGKHRPQYPGGPDQRARDIEAGRERAAREAVDDLASATAELVAAFDSVGDRWSVVVPAGVGPRTIRDRLDTRWYEVELHHVDLGVGHAVADWPAAFVALMLPRTVAAVGARRADGESGAFRLVTPDAGEWTLGEGEERGTAYAAGAHLLAWLAGRGDVDTTGDAHDVPRRFPHP